MQAFVVISFIVFISELSVCIYEMVCRQKETGRRLVGINSEALSLINFLIAFFGKKPFFFLLCFLYINVYKQKIEVLQYRREKNEINYETIEQFSNRHDLL